MSETNDPRPSPAAPPTTPGSVGPPAGDDGLESYQRVAETVGFMPSLRIRDNLVQGLVVLVSAALGAGIGWLISPAAVGIMLGAIAGLLGGTVISGIVLMVLGWVRASRSKR